MLEYTVVKNDCGEIHLLKGHPFNFLLDESLTHKVQGKGRGLNGITIFLAIPKVEVEAVVEIACDPALWSAGDKSQVIGLVQEHARMTLAKKKG